MVCQAHIVVASAEMYPHERKTGLWAMYRLFDLRKHSTGVDKCQ